MVERSVCSGLRAGSEIGELRMSEQMEEQRPREAKPFPRVTQLLGELGRQLPVTAAFLGQAFITTHAAPLVTLFPHAAERRSWGTKGASYGPSHSLAHAAHFSLL